MRELVPVLTNKYDLVLFNSPPVMSVTDTAVLSTQAEAVMLVAMLHETDRRALARTRELLGNVRATLLGAVVNRIEHGGLAGSNYYYYHYYGDGEGKRKRRSWWQRLVDRKI